MKVVLDTNVLISGIFFTGAHAMREDPSVVDDYAEAAEDEEV